MADYGYLTCADEARRARLRDPSVSLNGIDYIEVSAESLEAQRFLRVYFLKAPPALEPRHLTLEGGVRIRNIKVLGVEIQGDHLIVEVDQVGDFSTYTLRIDAESVLGIDPPYSSCDFSFKAGCPSRFDCRPRLPAAEEALSVPLIDYMAKDYASFRQALIDLVPTLVPDWAERHEADFGVALIDLMAYVADRLSYYQDAVANEAYLETARQRISVRRHTRLVDYHMHDGTSARVFVHFHADAPVHLPVGTQLLPEVDPKLRTQSAVVATENWAAALSAAPIVFETTQEVDLDPNLNQIRIHTWGNRECCLPAGTTTLDLKEDLTSLLKPGSLLLLEEAKSPVTAAGGDADPLHRQVVRLTDVKSAEDPLLTEKKLTRVRWSEADALSFPLCLSARRADGSFVAEVSIARGNLVLADHGRRILEEEHAGPQAPLSGERTLAHRITLDRGPLSFRFPPPKNDSELTPVARMLETDPRKAKPQVTELEVLGENMPQPGRWSSVPDLLDSGPFDPHFAVETGNEGRAQLRFGLGKLGLAPSQGSTIKVTYRIGVGSTGNIGAETLRRLVPADTKGAPPPITSLRNPLPAWGGVEPESMEEVKQLAPAAFRSGLHRAVTEEDYKRVAETHPEVDRAVARFRWTGSWHTVFVTIDVRGRAEVPAQIRDDVTTWINRHALAGYDVEVQPPAFVPIELDVDVCVARDHFRSDVEQAVLITLSNKLLPLGKRGFFHPDAFSFGDPLYLSRLYRTIEEVPGVDSAVVTRFKRLWEPTTEPTNGGPDEASRRNIAAGFIKADPLEIVRLDNDPNFPEHGVLRLNMLGGK